MKARNDVAGETAARLAARPRVLAELDARAVLRRLAEDGWSRVLYSEVQVVIEYVRGFGLAHLTRDPGMTFVMDALREDDWYRVSDDEIRLFALYVLETIET